VKGTGIGEEFAAELVHYAILQTPVKSITDGANANYTL